jgi:UDP-2,3-diacylglucosamine pyrophosphatase LpxH
MSKHIGKNGVPVLAAAAGIFAAVITFAFAIMLFSLEGTRGLLEWMPSYRRIFLYIPAAGFIPLLFLLPARRSKGLKILSLFVSFGLILFVLAGSALFFAKTRQLPERIPQINRISASPGKLLRHIAFSSDPHIGSGTNTIAATTAILRTANREKFDAFFILGDLAEMGVPGGNFDEASALFSAEIPDVPLGTLMGNHDALVGGSFRYGKFFNDNLYYRIDSGSVHIIALNTLWGTESLDRRQKQWLQRTLASVPPTDTTIVLTHCYLWASGYKDPQTGKKWFDQLDMITALEPLFNEAGVDLVVSGHNHFMEYLERPPVGGNKGTSYAVIGTMGGIPDPERTYVSPASRWYRADQFGFLDLSIFDDRMELTFRDETGKALHTIVR